MRATARLVLALAVLSLASCAVPDATEQGTAPKSAPVAPSASVDPCPIGTPVAGGDVVASALVTDAHGRYCAVAPAPGAKAMQLDRGVVEPGALETWGFSEDDALAAQTTAVAFVVEQALDSVLLDTDANGTFDDWLAVAPYRFVDFVPPQEVLLQGRLPLLARDGGPRAASMEIEVVEVSAQGGKSGPRAVTVQIGATSVFRPADGAEMIPVVTDYGLALDSEGGIVGVSYSHSVEG